MALAEGVIDDTIEAYCGPEIEPEDWDISTLKQSMGEMFGLESDRLSLLDLDDKSADEARDAIWSAVEEKYKEKEALIDASVLRRVEHDIMLQVVDSQWKDHLYGLDHLKEGIGLRGYGQRNPLVEYKRESFTMFQAMKTRIDEEIIRYLWRLRPAAKDEAGRYAAERQPAIRRTSPLSLNASGGATPAFAGSGEAVTAGGNVQPTRTGGDNAVVKTFRRDMPKVGRNDPCPCGSGKKYKKCHGA